MIVRRATIAPVRREAADGFARFVADGSHRVAVSADLAKGLGVAHPATIALPPGIGLKALGEPVPQGLTDKQRLAVEKAFVNLSNATLPVVRKYVPELSGPIDGFEVILATKVAFDAWSDPDRRNVVKPVIKTTRALFELVDVLKLAVPPLQQVPYLEAAGVAFKVGDSVWQFYCDYADAVKVKKPGGAG